MTSRLPSAARLLVLGGLLALAGCSDDPVTGPSAPAGGPAAATAVAEPAVRSISLDASTVTAGDSVTGTVVLTAPAPAGGTAVGVMSNDVRVATVEPGTTVAAGDTTATFRIATLPVASLESAAISATAGQVTVTTTLFVEPAGLAISSLAFSPSLVVKGGTTATGTVTLNGPAPDGGATVALSSSDTLLATVPASVTVPAGATTASFTLTPGSVSVATAVYVSASFAGVTRVARLLVDAPAPTGGVPTSVSFAPNPVVGGIPAQGTVTIASAVTSDVQIALSSLDPSVATVPASVTVPAGDTAATFPITTFPTSGSEFTVIYAEAGGVRTSATLTTFARPADLGITAVTLAPARIGGGGLLTGMVTFSGPAVRNSQSIGVRLTSSRPDVVQVPSGQFFGVFLPGTRTLAFPVSTRAVGASVEVTITATVDEPEGIADVVGTGTLVVTTDPPPPPDVVRVQSATFKFVSGRGGTLQVKATSTSSTAILTAFRDGATVPTMILTNVGGGKYEGTVSFDGNPTKTVTVTSDLGGSVTAGVKQ
ncbi:MAG TPA: hypothetical protein VFL93_09395 [Longimicrobiaceae bacterium]|nr:hypothetical protein [Longimicrobiaceae bacterium]